MPRKKKRRRADIPTQPWAALPELQALHALNARCFAELAQAARASAFGSATAAVEVLQSFTGLLDARACERAGRCPVLLVHLHFQEGDWWERIAQRRMPSIRLNGPPPLFTHDAAATLLREILIEAWSMGRAMPRAGRLLFGMEPTVIEVIARFSMQDIDCIVREHSYELRPRWEESRGFWARLLGAATGTDDEALTDVHLHCLALLGSGAVPRAA